MESIVFSYQQPYHGPGAKNALRRYLHRLAKEERMRIDSLSYVFCSDDFLIEINRDFLSHDDYTDIITFDLGQGEGGSLVSGEIYISLDRVKENAKALNQPIYRELHRVIFHGLLHLCGYKDKLKADQQTMREKEDFYLRKYFGR